MGGSNRCIVACAHLRNGTGRRTATLAAPLLLTSGPVRYEAVLHISSTSPGWGRGLQTCDSAHAWQLYNTASLELQAAGTMTCYPTQSYYPTSPCPILIIPSARLGCEKYQFLSHWFDLPRVRKLRGLDSNR